VKFATALVAGALFGCGLLISGMTNPANILGFLDVAGDWRPALALTMAGAILVAAPAFYFMRRRVRTLGGEGTQVPEPMRIDQRLVIGSAIFGVGWGLSGLCPGPALILLTGRSKEAIVFVASLALGMLLAGRLMRKAGA
jgi:uncharacterized membrane protein YedE/YeeE